MRRLMKRLIVCIPVLVFAWTAISHLLADDRRLLPDEALFMTFARHAAVGGDWWLQGSLDKPPLTIYANALMIAFVGADTLPNGVLTLDVYKGEFVGRLMSAFSGLLVIALSMRLALDLRRRTLAGVIVGVILPTLPMIQLYSTTVFMDMPMLALALAALLTATRRHALAAGLLLAVAFAAKPQAVFFVPLILWIVWTKGNRHGLMRFLTALVLGGGVLLVWDALRPGDSVFALGAANNDFFAPTLAFTTLAYRLGAWLPQSYPDVMRFSVFAIVLGSMMTAGLFYRPARAVSLWVIVYFAGHLMLFDTLYERYLLPVIPLLVVSVVCVISAWELPVASPHRRRGQFMRWPLKQVGTVAVCAISLVCWYQVAAVRYDAVTSQPVYPVTLLEDAPATGRFIDTLATRLNTLPTATVIYDHWLGWSLKYYMGEWHDKRIVYYPSPQALIAGIQSLDESAPRYFVMPDENVERYGLSSEWSEKPQAWSDALRDAGFDLIEYHRDRFKIYEIRPG